MTDTCDGYLAMEFRVYGKATGAARPRVAGGRAFMPKQHRLAETSIADAAAVAAVQQGFAYVPRGGTCAVAVVVWVARPLRMQRKMDRGDVVWRDAPGKPDLDNILKLVMDGVTRSGRVWQDDSCVVSVQMRRGYVGLDPDGQPTQLPHTHVVVTRMMC